MLTYLGYLDRVRCQYIPYMPPDSRLRLPYEKGIVCDIECPCKNQEICQESAITSKNGDIYISQSSKA